MHYILLLAVLIFSTAFCFGQTEPKPKVNTQKERDQLLNRLCAEHPEIEEIRKGCDERKEMEDFVKKAHEERDRALSKPQVIYYAPVIQPSAEHIAYVKRTVEYRLKGGGFIPFLSDSPEVTWVSDMIELCERDLATGQETTVEKWILSKPVDAREVGTVFVNLDWRDQLYYEINLTHYSKKEFPEAAHGNGRGINLWYGDASKDGANSANGITVSVDIESECYRYPTSNKIVITCEKSRPTCPVL
jgi:hypothetical protein